MFATVTYPYRDRETYEIHRTGDAVELTPERFAELSAAGYVDAAEQAAEQEPEKREEAEAAQAEQTEQAPQASQAEQATQTA